MVVKMLEQMQKSSINLECFLSTLNRSLSPRLSLVYIILIRIVFHSSACFSSTFLNTILKLWTQRSLLKQKKVSLCSPNKQANMFRTNSVLFLTGKYYQNSYFGIEMYTRLPNLQSVLFSVNCFWLPHGKAWSRGKSSWIFFFYFIVNQLYNALKV